MKTKKQKKADKAFMKKINTLTIGGKAVMNSDTLTLNIKCPGCGGTHGVKVCLERRRHNDSEEQAISA